MKNTDLLKIGSIAIATAAFTVMTFCLGSSQAGHEADLSPEVQTPKLAANGIEFSVAASGGQNFKPGAKPAFKLTAVNTTEKTATCEVRVAMQSTAPANKFSRVPMLPTQLWDHNETFTLRPKETKSVDLIAPVQLPANKMISVLLEKAEPSAKAAASAANQARKLSVGFPSGAIIAMNFSTQ